MGDASPGNPKLVRDLMTVGVATCPPDTPVVDVVRFLLDKDLEGMVVLDQDGQAVGVVGRDELVKAYSRDNVRDLVAEDVMTEGMHEVPPDPGALPAGCPYHPRCPHRLARCPTQRPPMIAVGDSHQLACWLDGGKGVS